MIWSLRAREYELLWACKVSSFGPCARPVNKGAYLQLYRPYGDGPSRRVSVVARGAKCSPWRGLGRRRSRRSRWSRPASRTRSALAVRVSRSVNLERMTAFISGRSISALSVAAGTSSRSVCSSATTLAVRGLPVIAAISPKKSPAPIADSARNSPPSAGMPATTRPSSTKYAPSLVSPTRTTASPGAARRTRAPRRNSERRGIESLPISGSTPMSRSRSIIVAARPTARLGDRDQEDRDSDVRREGIQDPEEPAGDEAKHEPDSGVQPVEVARHEQRPDDEGDRGERLLQPVLELGGLEGAQRHRQQEDVPKPDGEEGHQPDDQERSQDPQLPEGHHAVTQVFEDHRHRRRLGDRELADAHEQ